MRTWRLQRSVHSFGIFVWIAEDADTFASLANLGPDGIMQLLDPGPDGRGADRPAPAELADVEAPRRA